MKYIFLLNFLLFFSSMHSMKRNQQFLNKIFLPALKPGTTTYDKWREVITSWDTIENYLRLIYSRDKIKKQSHWHWWTHSCLEDQDQFELNLMKVKINCSIAQLKTNKNSSIHQTLCELNKIKTDILDIMAHTSVSDSIEKQLEIYHHLDDLRSCLYALIVNQQQDFQSFFCSTEIHPLEIPTVFNPDLFITPQKTLRNCKKESTNCKKKLIQLLTSIYCSWRGENISELNTQLQRIDPELSAANFSPENYNKDDFAMLQKILKNTLKKNDPNFKL